MSDYFLNKIYDSLLTKKLPKTKPTFRTLSESYNLVYEDETNQNQPTSNQLNQKQLTFMITDREKQPVSNQIEQGTVNDQEAFANADLEPPFKVKDVISRKKGWTKEQIGLYKLTENRKGYGPGEFAVASVISGYTDVASCSALASGGNLSYDVAFPSQEKPRYKFEVKMIKGNGTVFIAKHGTLVARKIQKDTEDIIQTILNQYNDLSEDGKEEVDNKLLSNINAEVGKELSDEERAMLKFLSNNPKIRKETPEQEQEYQELVSRRDISPGRRERAAGLQKLKLGKQWTVKKWCESILADIGEIPFSSILFKSAPKPGYDFPDITRDNPEDFGTKIYVLFSVEDFINIVNSIMQSEEDSLIPEPTRERRAGLAKTFKQYYGNNEGTNTELDNKLDAEATNVDKKLSSLKIKTLQTGYDDFNTFVRELKSAKLSEKLRDLKTYIDAPETVKGVFPKDLTGLFVVDPEGYHYFPIGIIPDHIKITTVTTGGVKIGFKHPPIM
jgi:hypothetical protein